MGFIHPLFLNANLLRDRFWKQDCKTKPGLILLPFHGSPSPQSHPPCSSCIRQRGMGSQPFDWETCSSRNYSSSSSPALLLAAAAADITRASRPATAAPQTAALGAKQIFHVIHQIGLGSTFCKGSRTFFV